MTFRNNEAAVLMLYHQFLYHSYLPAYYVQGIIKTISKAPVIP